MVIHLASAAHNIADSLILIAVTCAAWDGLLFKHVNMLSLHLSVAYQIAGRRQSSKPRPYDVSRFTVDALRLYGVCKCFIVTA